jgi:hypothetical protein
VDEVDWLLAPGRRLQELVPDASGSRTGGDVDVEQLSPLVANEEEDIEGPEAYGVDDEQVSRPDAAQLVGEEGSPTLVVARPLPPPDCNFSDIFCAGRSVLRSPNPRTVTPASLVALLSQSPEPRIERTLPYASALPTQRGTDAT